MAEIRVAVYATQSWLDGLVRRRDEARLHVKRVLAKGLVPDKEWEDMGPLSRETRRLMFMLAQLDTAEAAAVGAGQLEAAEAEAVEAGRFVAGEAAQARGQHLQFLLAGFEAAATAAEGVTVALRAWMDALAAVVAD